MTSTSSAAFAPKFKLLGTDDSVTVCEACGKKNLKYTVALEDQDGHRVSYGRDCAAVALRWGTKGDRTAAAKVWDAALIENRRVAGRAFGEQIKAELAAMTLPTKADLMRARGLEDGPYFVFVRKGTFPRPGTPDVSDPVRVYVNKGDHLYGEDQLQNAHGEYIGDTAIRLWPRAYVMARIRERHSAHPHKLDKSFEEAAAFTAALR